MLEATGTALIGLDWGTSSFRACRMDRAGRVLERRQAPAGIMNVAQGRFEQTLEEQVGDWLAAGPKVPVLASGMIGSRQGWVEVPYLACPAGGEAIGAALLAHTAPSGRVLHFVPGLSGRDPLGIPDVMRGEETQIVGALAGEKGTRLVLLPGTHSKWALVENGSVRWFASFMTGELFAVLRGHSILGRLMEGAADDEEGFARGVEVGLGRAAVAGGTLRRLFSARTMALMGDVPPRGVAAYLSGLLIASEVREALDCVDGAGASGSVLLVGGEALTARYAQALEAAAIGHEVAQGEPAARGQYLIARAAGLLG
ncbi:2-dehydro-3-deoxygalactonokinase [Geminicoccaceae bacterium 1502E]|nr:2-dehydro-3-deoxygalactonokinase [Geminicoccaceae bacterium 1502E]